MSTEYKNYAVCITILGVRIRDEIILHNIPFLLNKGEQFDIKSDLYQVISAGWRFDNLDEDDPIMPIYLIVAKKVKGSESTVT